MTIEDQSPAVDPDAAHLDTFRAPDIGEGEGLEDDVQRPDDEGIFEDEREPALEVMDKDAFWIVFSTAFAAPGIFIPDMKPVAIQPEEVEPARAASDAAHALLSIYYPKALTPMGETMAHVMILGPLMIAKVMIVRAVLDARRRPPPRDVTPKQDGAEPQFKSQRETKPRGPAEWMDAEEGAA